MHRELHKCGEQLWELHAVSHHTNFIIYAKGVARQSIMRSMATRKVNFTNAHSGNPPLIEM